MKFRVNFLKNVESETKKYEKYQILSVLRID